MKRTNGKHWRWAIFAGLAVLATSARPVLAQFTDWREQYAYTLGVPAYIMGINFPASLQVREDLGSTDNRPARRRQFQQLLPGVNGIQAAKAVIT